jgi:hypothetical protein
MHTALISLQILNCNANIYFNKICLEQNLTRVNKNKNIYVLILNYTTYLEVKMDPFCRK